MGSLVTESAASGVTGLVDPNLALDGKGEMLSFGLRVEATFNELAGEDSDDEGPNYLEKKASGTGSTQKEDTVTGNIEAKLNFRNFR